jgi:lysozyme family protein
MDKFDQCIGYVIENEGGFVNHPADSGGPTKYGVTLATLSRWRRQELTADDVQSMDVEEAHKIYYEYYWFPLRLYSIESIAVATAILDTAVLRGNTKAVMYMQKTCNAFISKKSPMKGLDVDGRISTDLTGRINTCDPSLWVQQFADFLKKAFIQITLDHPEKKVFLPGWLNRNEKMLTLINKEENGAGI